jgi:hypothetical protein
MSLDAVKDNNGTNLSLTNRYTLQFPSDDSETYNSTATHDAVHFLL